MNILFIICISFFSLTSILYSEQEDSLEILLTTPQEQTVEAGQYLSLAILINNKENSDISVKETLLFPENWQLSTQEEQAIVITAEKSLFRLITIFIPKNEKAGTFEVKYKLKSDKGIIYSAEPISVIVPKIIRISSTDVDRLPSFVEVGEDVSTKLLLTNIGNTTSTLLFNTSSIPANFKILFTPEQLTLESQESKEIEIKIISDPQLNHSIATKIIIHIVDSATEENVGRKDLMLTFFPSTKIRPDPYHYIPAELIIDYESQPDREMAFFTQRTYGSLQANSELDMTSILKIPWSINGLNTSSKENEVFIHLEKPNFFFEGGDINPFLSELTSVGNSGIGWAGSYKQRHWEIGGSMATDLKRSIEKTPFPETRGAFIRRYFSDSLWMTTTFFQDRGLNVNPFTDIVSIGATYDTAEEQITSNDIDYFINAEFANGKLINSPFKYGNSYFFHFSKVADEGNNYTFEYQFADPDFYGAIRDRELIQLNWSRNFFYRQIQSFINYYKTVDNVGKDAKRITAITSSDFRFGLNYVPSPDFSAILLYQVYTNLDLLSSASTNNLERVLEFTLNKQWNEYNFQLLTYGGNYLEKTLKKTLDIRGFRMQVDKDLTTNLFLSAFFEKGHRRRRQFPVFEKNYGLTGDLTINNWQFSTTYEREFIANALPISRTYLTINKSGSHGQTLQLYYEYIKTGPDDRHRVFLSYRMPFEAKLYPRNDIGSLSGKFYYTGSNGKKQPVGDAIVKIDNNKRIVNKDGQFAFYSIPVGDYELEFSNPPKGYLPKDDFPLPVKIYPAQEQEIKIELEPGANIIGTVTYRPFLYPEVERVRRNLQGKPNAFALGESRSIPNALVILYPKEKENELSSENVHITYTSPDGTYLFDKLLPGNWVIKVKNADLKTDDKILFKATEIKITEARQYSIDLNIEPVQRRIIPL